MKVNAPVFLLVPVLIAIGVDRLGAAQDRAATAPFVVWQLPRGAAVEGTDFPSRKGWRPLDPDAEQAGDFGGGVAVENQHLAAVLCAGGDGIVLFAKGKAALGHLREELILLGEQGHRAGRLHDLELIEHDAAEAVVAFGAGAVEARLKLGLGKVFVELVPGGGAGALEVRSPARFAFIPDFFGNDVLYNATETPGARVFPPTENFLVNLNDGQTALTMLVWPIGGGEEVLLLPEGTGPDRRFAAAQVSFSGKPIYVGVLRGEGIWHAEDLRGAPRDTTFVADRWKPPFAARWMTILTRRPAVGARAGLTSETLPIPTLPAEGAAPYSDVYYHPRVPSWLTGSQWRLHFETVLTAMITHEKVRLPDPLLAINYPRDRLPETPLDAFTLVDVMRGALGTGPCEYILDLEGLNKTRSTGAAGTGKPTTAATCAERGALVYYYLGERSEAARPDEPLICTHDALESVEKVKDFLDAAHARIQEYLAWSRQIVDEAKRAAAAEPKNRELADRIIPIALEMQQFWDTVVEHDKPCADPMEWRMALDHCKDLIRRGAPDVGQRIRDFDAQMRGAGEEVDGGMQLCRMIVKRIRQEAALAGSTDPEVQRFAATIRQRCRDVLRNKHYKEGDSVRLSQER